jgi:hypothetical protein
MIIFSVINGLVVEKMVEFPWRENVNHRYTQIEKEFKSWITSGFTLCNCVYARRQVYTVIFLFRKISHFLHTLLQTYLNLPYSLAMPQVDKSTMLENEFADFAYYTMDV